MRKIEYWHLLVRGFALALFVVASGCADNVIPDVRTIPATIVEEDGRYVIVSDSTRTRYVPDRIPLSYREDGLNVYLTGRTSDSMVNNGKLEVAIEVTSLSQRLE